MAVVLTRSKTWLTRVSSGSVPASTLVVVQRLKPVAIFCSVGRVRQQVAGELLDRELVERHVGVQGADDPVAIGPEVAQVVALEAVRVGVAGQVEPRPGPALAELRRGEQPIDDRFVGVRARVGDERIDFRRRRRQADQIEGHAADERRAIGFRRGRQPFAFQAARTKRSIAFRVHDESLTWGNAGRTGAT